MSELLYMIHTAPIGVEYIAGFILRLLFAINASLYWIYRLQNHLDDIAALFVNNCC